MIKLSCLAALVLLINSSAGAAEPTDQNTPSLFSPKCEIRQSTWCVMSEFQTITDQPANSKHFRNNWYVHGALDPRHPLVIREPKGCREGTSDVVELVRFDSTYRWRRKTWSRMVIRLKSNDSCNLELLFANYSAGGLREDFYSGLNLRACTDALCSGPSILEKLPEARNLR
jgi:hypothetical protein